MRGVEIKTLLRNLFKKCLYLKNQDSNGYKSVKKIIGNKVKDTFLPGATQKSLWVHVLNLDQSLSNVGLNTDKNSDQDKPVSA